MGMTGNIRVSYSQLKMLACPWKYAAHYVKKLPAREDKRAALMGIALHNALEFWLESKAFLKGKSARPILLSKAVQEFRTAAVSFQHSASQEDLDGMEMELINMINPTVDAIRDHKLVSAKMDVEKAFTFDFAGVKVYIRPDVIVYRRPGVGDLIDFKTSSSVEFVDSFQLEFYARFLSKYAGLEIQKRLFLMTRTGEVVQAENKFESDREFFEYVREAIQVALEIRSDPGRFEPVPGQQCVFCEYSHLCPVEGVISNGLRQST